MVRELRRLTREEQGILNDKLWERARIEWERHKARLDGVDAESAFIIGYGFGAMDALDVRGADS